MTVRRLKTYTADTGYVYQYYFVGKRPAIPPHATSPSTEYIFDVTSDRKTTYAVSVFLSQAVCDAWAAVHARSLTEAEQYGAVKLRLFQAFDELEDVSRRGRALVVDSTALATALSTLGID